MVKAKVNRISSLRNLGLLLLSQFWIFFVLLFFGSLIWAHSRDPFRRTEFSVKTADGHEVHGITVLPREVNRLDGSLALPIVIYAHGSGGSWLSDGNVLRQFAELGMAAVGFDYDQTNGAAFDGEFSAVLDYVRQQPWVNTNEMAWVGFSLGSQNTLAYFVKHPESQPQVYVRLSGGAVEEIKKDNLRIKKSEVLLVHAENDETFPLADAKRVETFFRSNGVSVSLRVVSGHGHGFEADQPVVFRLVAEYCKGKLTLDHPLPEFPVLHPYPFLWCILPAVLWIGVWWRFGRARLLPSQAENRLGESLALPLTKFEIGLRVVAVVLGTLAIGDTALHLVPPRLPVSVKTLDIARKHLLAPNWPEDFESLAALPIWQGQKLKTLLTQVELAHYTVFELVNWKLEDSVYRQFVLSPVIVGGERELAWRRELWENFYPRVRHENSTADAAEIIVRFLRQRVTVVKDYPNQLGVESMWNGHIVNPNDFEVLYVAALRSAGVPARLDGRRLAEFWTGQDWKAAPRPLAGL